MNNESKLLVDLSLPDEEIIKLCKEIINDRPHSNDAKEALKIFNSVIRADYLENYLRDKENLGAYLSDLRSKYPNSDLSNQALKYMVYSKMLNSDDSAIALADSALAVFSGEDHKEMLINLACIYTHSAQLDKAKSILGELKEKYSDDELIDLLEEDISDIEREIAEGRWDQGDDVSNPPETPNNSSIADKVSFSPIFPNPFNPLANISFSLPTLSRVNIEVYDLTGRCVAILSDRSYAAGTYTVQFDGTYLASGIYFIRSKVVSSENPKNNEIFTDKIMLMK